MNTIKIVRLKNGEDIIGKFAEGLDGILEINCPMSVNVVPNGRHQGLVMSHWLPVQLIKKNEITLNPCDVLTVFEPNEEFAEYYTNTVEKIEELLKAKEITDNLTDEEVEDIMDALDDSQGQTLH
jgi:SAM-dependent MidA family methyltransferase